MAHGKLRGGMPRARATQPLGQRTPRNVVGSQVRAVRKAQRLMQRDLCARCQVAGFDLSRESLAKIESGFRVVSDTEVVLLAWALRVPLLTLFPDENTLGRLLHLSDEAKFLR